MKQLRIWSFSMIILAGILDSAFAQSRLTEEEKQEAIERYQQFEESLQLTEEQKIKTREINIAYFDGLRSLKESPASKLDKYRTYKKLNATRDSEMKTVLNKEQFRLYKQYQEQARERAKDRWRANRQ